MSRRELNSLIREGVVTTASRLRNGEGTQVQREMDEDQTVDGIQETVSDSQELQQKLVMAGEELESVRADYEQQLSQTRETAERARGKRRSASQDSGVEIRARRRGSEEKRSGA